MKCILCSFWKAHLWETIRHTGEWVYQQNRMGERRILKGPKRGTAQPDQQWVETGVFKS